MESVDIPDLKSGGPSPCGFKSHRPHQDTILLKWKNRAEQSAGRLGGDGKSAQTNSPGWANRLGEYVRERRLVTWQSALRESANGAAKRIDHAEVFGPDPSSERQQTCRARPGQYRIGSRRKGPLLHRDPARRGSKFAEVRRWGLCVRPLIGFDFPKLLRHPAPGPIQDRVPKCFNCFSAGMRIGQSV